MGPFRYIFHDPNIGMQFLTETAKFVNVKLLSTQHNIHKLMKFYNNHSAGYVCLRLFFKHSFWLYFVNRIIVIEVMEQ